ncbi:MAG: hypothetical protein FJX72_05785 [Armatimonadetes bacterium]|nr:hypothetical protein [Armatimonadota bacterium]
MNTPFPKQAMRSVLSSALPEVDTAGSATAQPAARTYVPPSHARALDRDAVLVEGIRGAGKSFWWAALHSVHHRQFVAEAFPEAGEVARLSTSQGYGTAPSPDYPSKDILADVVGGHAPRHVWRAVVATQLGLPSPFPSGPWRTKVEWVASQAEALESLLLEKDRQLAEAGLTHIILFDALDRLADDWTAIRPLAKALLQLALDMRSLRAIRLKLFVRPDMLGDDEILAFPDASKLLARKAELRWRRADLYALMYQCMGNAEQEANQFRDHCRTHFGLTWERSEHVQAWILPAPLRNDEYMQKRVFHEIAGPAMASGPSGHKRGFPYTWLPNHLMDGREQVSPRSFSAALRNAATFDAPADWPYALHYRGIHTGVQEASRIRVEEITREDYPWVSTAMAPLHGRLSVPCDEDVIARLWEDSGTLQQLGRLVQQDTPVKLPPQHLDQGASGVLRDLADLGVVQRLISGRIQMPDVYRVAFGLGRRGGVRPLR